MCQTIANVQSIIVIPSGEAIIIGSIRNNLAILADTGFNPIADDIAIAIGQRQIARTAGDGRIRCCQLNQGLRIVLLKKR